MFIKDVVVKQVAHHHVANVKNRAVTVVLVANVLDAQKQISDTESEASNSSEQLEHEVNELMHNIFGDSEIDIHCGCHRGQFLIT